MTDERHSQDAGSRPKYKIYRAGSKEPEDGDPSGLSELRAGREAIGAGKAGGARSGGGRSQTERDRSSGQPEMPASEWSPRRSGRSAGGGGRDGGDGHGGRGGGRGAQIAGGEPGRRRQRKRWGPRRVIKYLALALFSWLALSLILFLVSAQIESSDVGEKAGPALSDAGFPLISANTILVLGSDARTKNLHEPGSVVGAPGRSDSIILIRAGGGKSAKLSIPRDTVVNIPGHGRSKINAAYAYGGPRLAAQTIKEYLGIDINHVVEVNFDNFPAFIDSIGGIDYTGGCVNSDINGGKKNGGYSLRLKAGTTHIDGKAALALARTRKNKCNLAENDLQRAERQQKIVAGVKDQLTSFTTFFRLPWVAWEAPKAIKTDMGGFTMLGLFGAMATAGGGETAILKPSGGVTLPDGGAGLVVSESERRSAVARFLEG